MTISFEDGNKPKAWIGVDLDGTLAEYTTYNGIHIGEPIDKMVNRVKLWLKSGKRVKIFTARAQKATEEELKLICDWCIEHIGQELEITCQKDYHMIELWDDRAVQVVPNTGMTIEEFIREHKTN